MPGRAGESANVGVLPGGHVVFSTLDEDNYPTPLDDKGPGKVAASANGRTHWKVLDSGGNLHDLEVPPWMSVDPDTHRIWFASALPDLCGADISWSDDGGRRWTSNDAVGCPGMGSMRILEGLAPRGGAKPQDYPHVVYYCANGNDFSASQLYCYRSLDGGKTFTLAGIPDPPPTESDTDIVPAGCDSEHPARPGAVGANGDLYMPVYECGQVSVAISSDEGSTWHYVHVATSNVQDLYISSMAVDRAGNVYLAWIQGPGKANGASLTDPVSQGISGSGRPVISVSRNRGRTWSRPNAIEPPHVRDAGLIAISAGGRGHVAVSFLGNRTGGPLLDGYLANTGHALDRHGLWWSATANDPRTPLISTKNSETFGNRLFFTTDTVAPTGLPYGAWHCADTTACPNQRVGVIGHLTRSRAVRR